MACRAILKNWNQTQTSRDTLAYNWKEPRATVHRTITRDNKMCNANRQDPLSLTVKIFNTAPKIASHHSKSRVPRSKTPSSSHSHPLHMFCAHKACPPAIFFRISNTRAQKCNIREKRSEHTCSMCLCMCARRQPIKKQMAHELPELFFFPFDLFWFFQPLLILSISS